MRGAEQDEGMCMAEPWAESMIRVKRIYNFLLFHACFTSIPHVCTLLLYHFKAFYLTNLLTRCPVPLPCFCDAFVAEKLLLQIFSELHENLRGVFIRQDEARNQRAS